MARKSWEIIEKGTNSGGHPVGTVVYDPTGHDYGLASDDTRLTGVEHVSVTLDPEGEYPTFTVGRSSLKERVL